MSGHANDYEVEGDALYQRRRIDDADLTLAIRAEHVRRERTGVHAKLTILANSTILAWANFNIERDEDRVRLANSAYKHLDRLKNIYPPGYLKADLDKYCYWLWDAHLERYMPTELSGTLERTPPDFLLRPYVLSGGGTILFGPPGRGKSYTLFLMAVCMHCGLQDLWSLRRAPVLVINLERSPRSVADRLGNINQVLGLERGRKIGVLNARGKSLTDVTDSAGRYIAEHGVECVFVDSISRAGAGDLNANENVNRIIDTLNGLCETWVGLAHTPRSDESHLYGGIHFEAGADIVVQLLSEQASEGPLGVGLQITKNNDVGKTSMWVGAYEFDSAGLTGVRKAHVGEFSEIASQRKLSMKDAIKEYLLDVGPSTAWDIADALGFNRSNIATVLASDGNSFTRGGKVGQRVLYAVRA